MKAVIPAAGLGTRFLPATKAQPKEMLPLVDKPAIQFVVEECVASGIDDILIITGRGKRAIEDHFDHSVELESVLSEKNPELLSQIDELATMADIHYVRQKKPLGLGHAIWCARKHVDGEAFSVLLGDDVIFADTPCIRQCLDGFERKKAPVVAVEAVSSERISQYGVIDPGERDGDLIGIRDLVEKPAAGKAPSRLGIVGRYVLTPDIFDELSSTREGVGGEIQLTDALKSLNQREKMYALVFKGKRYDLGSKQDYLKASVEYALSRGDLKKEFMKYLRGRVK